MSHCQSFPAWPSFPSRLFLESRHMLGAALNRLIGMAIVMAIVVTIVFIIVRVTPGDPAAVMLGPDATAADDGENLHQDAVLLLT